MLVWMSFVKTELLEREALLLKWKNMNVFLIESIFKMVFKYRMFSVKM